MWFRWDDIEPGRALFEDLRRRMERVWEETETERRGGVATGGLATGRGGPRVSLADRGTTLEIQADVPGVGENDLQLTVNQDVLSLAGERKFQAPEGYRVHRQERPAFKFSRSYALPCKVDPEKVQASLKDGVLTVVLEKAAESRPRQISVQAK